MVTVPGVLLNFSALCGRPHLSAEKKDDLADSGKASESPMVQSQGRKAVLLALALRIGAGTL